MSPRKAKPSSEPQASPRKKSPTNKKPTENEPPVADLQRINKVLAAAGLGSRRHVDELIEQGRVEIDGKVVTQVGIKVDMSTASISVDGELLKQYRPVYFAVHKPEGVLCTNRDPQGRLRVIDFVPNQFRLFPVGRLDAFSTGLIILTNDGELAQQLTHPKHEIPKRYSVIVAGQVELEALKRLERGIYLAEGKAQVDHAKLKKVRKSSTEIEITLSEGKNREIRRVLARLGHKVVSLKRIAIGPLKLSDLPEGAYRPLSNHEVQGLYQAVEEIRRERKAARKARKKLASASQESESAEQDSPRSRSPKAHAPHGIKPNGIKPLGKSPQANLSDRKSTKAPKERSRETLPSLAQNPFATEEDFDDDDRIDDQSQPDLGQTEPLILVRDLGPSRPSRKDSGEEFFFMPRRPAGTVIGQEQANESEGFEFELNDPDDDLFEDESFDPDDSQRPARGPKGKRPAGKAAKPRAGSPRAGSPRAGSRRSERAGLTDSQDTQDTRQGGPRPGAPNRGRPSRPRSEADRTSRGGRDSTGSKFAGSKSGETDFRETRRSGPKRAGPKSGAPKRGGPRMGGPKSGGPKRGGPKSGGPKSGGPKRGGPKRGGGRGRSKS